MPRHGDSGWSVALLVKGAGASLYAAFLCGVVVPRALPWEKGVGVAVVAQP